jgi:hypothetical protein
LLISRNYEVAIGIRVQGKQENCVTRIYKFESKDNQPHERPYMLVGGQRANFFLRKNEGPSSKQKILREGK